MVKQIAAIYPFSLLFAPVARFHHLLEKYTVVSAVVPGCYRANGADVSWFDDSSPVGIPIETDFAKALQKIQTVIWADYNYDALHMENFKTAVIEKMVFALQSGKNIVCTQPLDAAVLSVMQMLAARHKVTFLYCADTTDAPKDTADKPDDLTVPVVSLMGLTENCSKFHTQLALREMLLADGYRVAQVGSRHYCELFGFHSFPAFMFANDLPEEEKIKGLNLFLQAIIKKERPDMLIVGIPGGLLPLTKKITMRYGITAYEACNAFAADLTVLHMGGCPANNEYIATLREILAHKFNTSLDCICMSNICLNADSMTQDHKGLEYDVMPVDEVDKLIRRETALDVPVYNAMDIRQLQTMKKYIISSLLSNA